MGSNGFSGVGAGLQWPSRPPRDLAIRLADALQYEGCDPQDLWAEIEDWMNLNRVVPPNISPVRLISHEEIPPGSRKFPAIKQKSSSMQITRLVYTSRHKGLSQESVDVIVQRSRANNVRDLITGILITGEDYFMQLIEGGRSEISRCFMRITQDRSHHDIQVISCGDVSRRLFQEWNMQLIEASRIRKGIVSCYEADGTFDPSTLSEFAIEDFCRVIANGNWRVGTATLDDPKV